MMGSASMKASGMAVTARWPTTIVGIATAATIGITTTITSKIRAAGTDDEGCRVVCTGPRDLMKIECGAGRLIPLRSETARR